MQAAVISLILEVNLRKNFFPLRSEILEDKVFIAILKEVNIYSGLLTSLLTLQ